MLLNMCSAERIDDPGAGDVDGDDARARILRVAIDLIGSEGAKAATVRRVAAAADVSPALVMHHFGSKDGLTAACDAQVMQAIERIVAALGDDEREVSVGEMIAAKDGGPAIAYVGRAMQDGGSNGATWFDRMIALTETGTADLVAAGLARPSDDPKMRAVLLLAMDIGVVLMRQNVERYLGAALTDRATARRWAVTELDLLTNGVLVAPTEHSDPPNGAT